MLGSGDTRYETALQENESTYHDNFRYVWTAVQVMLVTVHGKHAYKC